MLPRLLDPRHILVVLDEIDQEAPSHTLTRPAAMRRVFVTLASVSVALLALHYLKFGQNLVWVLQLLASWNGQPENHYVYAVHNAGWYQLLIGLWWAVWHWVCFLLLPWVIIRFVWRERMLEFGWRWGHTHRHWPGYALLISPILVFIALVSLGEDFVNHYPFYPHAGRSWFDFFAWQALYISQFVVLEFFFRGYMLQALRPAMGANAVWVMCIPYLMIHFPKLWLEATGAILFGLFLGILALRSRSIWGGVVVHVGIALSMDMAALLRKGDLPAQWWPF